MNRKNNHMDYTGFGQGEVNLFDNSVTRDKVTDNWVHDSPVLESVVDEDYDDKKKSKVEEHLVTKNGLFILDEEGKKVNRLAKQFFSLVNSRCGGIFKLDVKNGAIQLNHEKKSTDVVSSSTVSKIFAQLIEENIEENATQKIIFRVGKNVFGKEGTGIVIDNFSTGKVDLKDLLAIGSDVSIQTTLIYHFFYERIYADNYEKIKSDIITDEKFKPYHDPALIAEVDVLKDMGRNPSFSKRWEFNRIKISENIYKYGFAWGNGLELHFISEDKTSKIFKVTYGNED